MTSKRRNLTILAAVAAVLVLAALLIIPGSPLEKRTVLGLDLRGGVELVYEGRPTPQVPEVTPQAIDDAIETIRKRTDALGVSEPEIQRAGPDQIAIGLPDVDNADRAEEQVGTTAQLQFYDWEPNVIGPNGQPGSGDPNPTGRINGLYEAVQRATKGEPQAEETDIPPGAPDDVTREEADRENDTAGDLYYLFGPDGQLITGPDTTCKELLQDFEEELPPSGQAPGAAPDFKKGTECESELKALGSLGPPAGSEAMKVPQGIVVVKDEESQQPTGPQSPEFYYVLEDDSELSGSDIKNPEQNVDPNTQEPIVTMEFTDNGRQRFADVTQRIADRGSEIIKEPGVPEENYFQRFAITLDNQIVSLATIDYLENPEGIDGRTGAQINGIGSLEDTQDLAESLRIGALPINLKLISKTQVSATLGQQALDEGLLAAAVGLFLTLMFLLVFYRVLGALAAIALLVYAVLLFALIKLIPITLTLPGIAGMLLTLGVAADANIVVFERVKEEVRAGRSIPASIAAGYTKALRTIIDANVCTIGVAFILFMLATAGIKGFAFTLGVGTLTSLFTAVLFTSALMGSLSRTRLLGSRFALGASGEGRPWTFDFMGKSKWFFSMSGLILAIGALAIAGKGLNFGIDFESGTRIKTPVEQLDADTDDVREALPSALQDAEVQQVEEPDLGENVFQISTETLEPEEVQRVREVLDEELGIAQADFSSSSIGPTFGEQIARTALIAVIASLILISLYIGLRFEPKYAVPVLIALFHDIMITAGVYALADREVTTSTVAALLTILGYSLYDTIIVFDRIRENVPRMPRAAFTQIVNRSMAEVLTRSLATSLCTLLPVTALMLFGGETLQDFAFALLVGILSGAYSSIFIASPVLSEWKEREPVYRRRRKLIMAESGGVVPAFATGAIADQEPQADGAAASAPRAPRRRPARRSTPPPAGGATTATATAPPKPPEVEAPKPPAVEAPKPPEIAPPDVEPPRPPASEESGSDGADGPKPKRQRPRKKHGRR
ncbi:MAG TPA: protein translocase subunit SecD [Thermoleophilaceae bacterium]|nr:protein translocase subunit SecD [Thermoleophilaceae bacterium]